MIFSLSSIPYRNVKELMNYVSLTEAGYGHCFTVCAPSLKWEKIKHLAKWCAVKQSWLFIPKVRWPRGSTTQSSYRYSPPVSHWKSYMHGPNCSTYFQVFLLSITSKPWTVATICLYWNSILDDMCYGLNVCVSLKFICRSSNSQRDCIWRCGLWGGDKVKWGHTGGALIQQAGTLTGRGRDTKAHSCQQLRKSLTRNQISQHLDLTLFNLAIHERGNFCCLIHPVYGIYYGPPN